MGVVGISRGPMWFRKEPTKVSDLHPIFPEEFPKMVFSRRRYSSHDVVGLTSILLQICTSDAIEPAQYALGDISSLLSEDYAPTVTFSVGGRSPL